MACEKYKLDREIKFCDDVDMGALDAVLINAADIKKYTASSEVGEFNVFTAIELVSSAKGYKVFDARKNPFAGSSFGHVEGEIVDKTSKTIQFVVREQGAEGAKVVQQLGGGGYVMVLRTRNNEFEIIGKNSPLYLTDKTKSITEGEGGWTVTMSTEETVVGNFLFDTDYETTLATYEALTETA